MILHLQKCRSSNPLMETMKKNNKAYTALLIHLTEVS